MSQKKALEKLRVFKNVKNSRKRECVSVCVRKRERGKDRMKMTERERKIVKRE
jgi:hypothetical protein